MELPSNSTLGIYPRKMKTYVYTATGRGMFIPALFIIAKKWELLKGPPADEWIHRCVSIQWAIIQP